MSLSDSDDDISSPSTTTEYTTTNVMLGFATEEATRSDDGFSRLGGRPVWPASTASSPGHFAKCRNCSSLLCLLLQLNADLPAKFPGHERRLYVFTCRDRACTKRRGGKEGCIRALRATRVQAQHDVGVVAKKTKKGQQSQIGQIASGAKPTRGEDLFGANPFSTSGPGLGNPFASPTGMQSGNPFATSQSVPSIKLEQDTDKQEPSTIMNDLPATFAQKVALTSPSPSQAKGQEKKPWPSEDTFPSAYPSYYLDAELEALDPTPLSSATNNNVKVMDMEVEIDETGDTSNDKNSGDDKEAYESTIDKTFQRFADRLAQNPEQVLRYEHDGVPLLYSHTDSAGKSFVAIDDHQQSNQQKRVFNTTTANSVLPRCPTCNAKRVFEMQLVPHAIAELECEESGLDGMEWGTVIIATCSADCSAPRLDSEEWSWQEEWVAVQWEEQGR